MKPPGARIAASLLIALACTAVPPTAPPVAPTNSCPEHPCAAYALQSPQPTCSGGSCLAGGAPLSASSLVLVVAIPEDALYAPGRSYVQRVSDLDASAPLGIAPSVQLPAPASVYGFYDVDPQAAKLLHWELGNAGQTILPVQVTYRALWDQSPAVDVGLPLYPVFADQVEQKISPAPGPANGPGITFSAYLAPGTYEQTIAPQPPFDQAFPPDVSVVTVGGTVQQAIGLNPETTQDIEPNPIIPQFDIRRGLGLDGWTAYLRDATTKRPISPQRGLSGNATPDGGVLLPTSHHPANGDALSNAELVIAPPSGSPWPSYIVPTLANVLPRRQEYPALPLPVRVSGTVSRPDGAPASAAVEFAALKIYAPLPAALQGTDGGDTEDAGADDGGNGRVVYGLNDTNFEFAARATTLADGSYSVALIPGEYLRVVRPLDTSSAMTSGVLWVDWQTAPPSDDVRLDPRSHVMGSAMTADRRALAGATVEALPIHCPTLIDHQDAALPNDLSSCRPRALLQSLADAGSAPSMTDIDGGFSLDLDPGGYLVRVEPAQGTRLPWMAKRIVVPTSSPVDFVIPAPAYRGMVLNDVAGNPVASAIVELFAMSDSGTATQVGRATTDTNGRFDVYIDPGLP